MWEGLHSWQKLLPHHMTIVVPLRRVQCQAYRLVGIKRALHSQNSPGRTLPHACTLINLPIHSHLPPSHPHAHTATNFTFTLHMPSYPHTPTLTVKNVLCILFIGNQALNLCLPELDSFKGVFKIFQTRKEVVLQPQPVLIQLLLRRGCRHSYTNRQNGGRNVACVLPISKKL